MKDAAYDQKSLVYRFQRHVLLKGILKPKGSYLIGCSGGADSVALFHLMRTAFPDASIALAHFNHGLRARTAKRDELFVKKIAKEYKVPFITGQAGKKKAKKNSVEEWAREQRYHFLSSVYKRKKYDALLLAHHADDQAETVLMRMCQGTGPRGLLAVREEVRMNAMRCVRPLLPFLKTEILKFLKEMRFKFCEDETNAAPQYLRNRIRRNVLPYLQKQINPQVVRALARIPEIVRDENELIENLAAQVEKQLRVRVGKKTIRLNARIFRKAHFALQFRVLDRAIKRFDLFAGVLFEHAALIKSSLGKPAFVMDLPRGIKLVGNKTTITVEYSFRSHP